MKEICLADNHCHLLKEYYQNTAQEVERLEKGSGLKYIASMGVDFNTNKELLDLKNSIKTKFLKIGAGIHPEEVIKLGKLVNHEIDRVGEQIRKNADLIDFVGEVGIDYSYPHSKEFRDEQLYAFRTLCQLAIDLGKPISIHARESFDDIMNIIDYLDFQPNRFNGFLHCFTGNFEQGMFFIEKGFKLGIGGIITYKKSDELRNTVKDLIEFYSDKSFDDLFGLETDSPYLAPEPKRGETNSPENIKIIRDFIVKEILE